MAIVSLDANKHPGGDSPVTPVSIDSSSPSPAAAQALALLKEQALIHPKGASSPAQLDLGTHHQLYGPGKHPATHDGRHTAPTEARAGGARGDSAGEGRSVMTPEPSLDDARAHLSDLARQRFKDDPHALQAFQSDMTDFEKRMGQTADGKGELARTFTQVSRLLDAQTSAVFPQDRAVIAGEIMHRAAHSTETSQGENLDCAAAFIASRLYTLEPSKAARAVVDEALTAKYVDPKGRTITLDYDTVANHQTGMSDQSHSIGLEERNHADQILQAVVRNEYLQDLNGGNDNKNGLRYEIHRPDAAHPTGEYVYDYSKTPPHDFSSLYAGLPSDSAVMESIYQKMSGKEEWDFVMDSGGTGANVDEFKQRLQYMDGKYPIALAVNPSEEPFKTSMGMPDDAGILHAITVEGFDPKTGMIRYRNPAFGSRELTISAEDMFNAMHFHRSDDDVQRQIDSIKTNGAKAAATPEGRESLANDIRQYIFGTEPRQREAVLDRISKESGVNMLDYLSVDQQEALGVRPSWLSRLFD